MIRVSWLTTFLDAISELDKCAEEVETDEEMIMYIRFALTLYDSLIEKQR